MLVALIMIAGGAFGLGYVLGRTLERPMRIDRRRRPTMIEPYRRRRYDRLQRREEDER